MESLLDICFPSVLTKDVLDKRLSRYPGILIGRLAVSTNFSGCGYGSEVLRFVKEWFVDDANKSGCRLAIVDAKVCLGIS